VKHRRIVILALVAAAAAWPGAAGVAGSLTRQVNRMEPLMLGKFYTSQGSIT
jgi:hypothetical protein